MTDSVRTHLTAAARGLQYVSESEAPFEFVEAPLPAGGVLTAATVAQAFGERAAAAREVEVDEFFAGHVDEADPEDAAAQATVERFRKLAEEVRLHLHDPFVYCYGETEKRCYIVGAAEDKVAGLRTTTYET